MVPGMRKRRITPHWGGFLTVVFWYSENRRRAPSTYASVCGSGWLRTVMLLLVVTPRRRSTVFLMALLACEKRFLAGFSALFLLP